MTDHVHLITEQDVHAYIDGELAENRRRAVEAFLERNALSARAAVAYLRAGLELRAMRDELYRDDALRGEVEALLAKRSDAAAKGAGVVASRNR